MQFVDEKTANSTNTKLSKTELLNETKKIMNLLKVSGLPIHVNRIRKRREIQILKIWLFSKFFIEANNTNG